jgi:hypothetical protein
VATIVDLPIVGAGEVVGTLCDSSGSPLEGVDMELVDRSGLAIASTRSDFDGFFSFESVAYGQYQLRLTKLSASVINASADLGISADINNGTPSVRLGRVLIGGPSPMRLAYQDVLMEGRDAGSVVAGGR